MQKRHTDGRLYFNELANTSRNYYLDYVQKYIELKPETRILEIGCGEGGNLALEHWLNMRRHRIRRLLRKSGREFGLVS